MQAKLAEQGRRKLATLADQQQLYSKESGRWNLRGLVGGSTKDQSNRQALHSVRKQLLERPRQHDDDTTAAEMFVAVKSGREPPGDLTNLKRLLRHVHDQRGRIQSLSDNVIVGPGSVRVKSKNGRHRLQISQDTIKIDGSPLTPATYGVEKRYAESLTKTLVKNIRLVSKPQARLLLSPQALLNVPGFLTPFQLKSLRGLSTSLRQTHKGQRGSIRETKEYLLTCGFPYSLLKFVADNVLVCLRNRRVAHKKDGYTREQWQALAPLTWDSQFVRGKKPPAHKDQRSDWTRMTLRIKGNIQHKGGGVERAVLQMVSLSTGSCEIALYTGEGNNRHFNYSRSFSELYKDTETGYTTLAQIGPQFADVLKEACKPHDERAPIRLMMTAPTGQQLDRVFTIAEEH